MNNLSVGLSIRMTNKSSLPQSLPISFKTYSKSLHVKTIGMRDSKQSCLSVGQKFKSDS